MVDRKSIKRKPIAMALAMVAAATMLQGCVAAIPVAAGGLMAGSTIDSDDGDTASMPRAIDTEEQTLKPAASNPTKGIHRADQPVANEPENTTAAAARQTSEAAPKSSDSAAAVASSAEAAAMSVDAQSSTVSREEPLSQAVRTQPDTQPGSDPASLARSQGQALRDATSARPDAATDRTTDSSPAATSAPLEAPKSPSARNTAVARPEPAPNAITQMLSYANQREFVSGSNRMSAMLADRVSLTPDRAQCGGVKPAVLIDLDPQGGTFDPMKAGNPPAGLGAGLSQLRTRGIHIGWISQNPETRSNLIRRALTRTGLDIYGRDTVLLIRKDEDRKQTLREEFAKTYCLIAIAGDSRSDFDELYDYLLDPSEATTLEPLYGDGWFIIPQPLVPQG